MNGMHKRVTRRVTWMSCTNEFHEKVVWHKVWKKILYRKKTSCEGKIRKSFKEKKSFEKKSCRVKIKKCFWRKKVFSGKKKQLNVW